MNGRRMRSLALVLRDVSISTTSYAHGGSFTEFKNIHSNLGEKKRRRDIVKEDLDKVFNHQPKRDGIPEKRPK